MPRQQSGYIWKHNGAWYDRWREDILEDGVVVRRQRSRKLADVCDRYRTKADVRPLLAEILRPINESRTRPEGTLPVADFVEDFYLPFVEGNFMRDFRTGDAANLLAEIFRQHNLGRSTLKHIKSFLSGAFTFAKNQGAFDGVNPIRDAMIPKKAARSVDTHAASPGEVLAIMDTLDKANEQKARAAVALMFFTGLRPGEARGVCWEDFDGKRLYIRQSVWHTHTTSPKTESSEKPVPIIEPLKTILAELRLADGNPSSGSILRGPSGKPLDLHNLANRVVIPVLKKAGIKWHGWYSLRRWVGTAMTALPKDSLAAKELLRHSSVSTTERHYIKDVLENTLQAMKQLEALCNNCATEKGTKPS